MKKTVKKRNPNDSTFRNINALKAKVAALTTRVQESDRRVAAMEKWIGVPMKAKRKG